jgi:TatD DNase family protein
MIDSHAHYDDRKFDGDRNSLLPSLADFDIELVINIGADMRSSRASIKLAERYPFIYATVGVHPHDAKSMNGSDLDELRRMTEHPKVVAIGEIGLDYHYDHSPRDIQRERFGQQLELAAELKMPVVIHSREACADTWAQLRGSGHKGVIHCYSGSAPQAVNYVNEGFYIGIGGVITYKNARKLAETVEAIPLARILLETDCPYLSPEPHRGKRNSSAFLTLIAQRVAEIKGVSAEEVEAVNKENVLELFGRTRPLG